MYLHTSAGNALSSIPGRGRANGSSENLLVKVLVGEHMLRGAFVGAQLSGKFSERDTIAPVAERLRIDDTGDTRIEDVWWQVGGHLRGSDHNNTGSSGDFEQGRRWSGKRGSDFVRSRVGVVGRLLGGQNRRRNA